MRLRLALALSRHAGKPLTQDLARQVLDEVCAGGSSAIALEQFTPREWRGYVIKPERIAGQEAALAVSEAAFWSEISARPGWNAEFELQRLREDEEAGLVLLLVARDAGGMLAVLIRVRVWFDAGEGALKARDEMVYVLPAHRGWLGVELCRYAERCCFALGARDFTAYCHESTDSARVTRFLGYRKVATVYQKVAQDACDYSRMPSRHRKGVAHEPLAPD